MIETPLSVTRDTKRFEPQRTLILFVHKGRAKVRFSSLLCHLLDD